MIRITMSNKDKYISIQTIYEILRSWSYRGEKFIYTDVIAWLPNIMAFEVIDSVTVDIVFNLGEKIRIKDDSPNSFLDTIRILYGKSVAV